MGRIWVFVLTAFSLKRIAVHRDGHEWGITWDGKVTHSPWPLDQAQWSFPKGLPNGSKAEDISVGSGDVAWLVGADGSVWTTPDAAFFQPVAPPEFGATAISAASEDSASVTKKDGSVWRLYFHEPSPNDGY
jgi:hypothetical protein